MAFKIQIMPPATFTTVKMASGGGGGGYNSLELGVQASVPGDLELFSPRAFVQINGHPGKAGCVYQGIIWSQPPFLALAVVPLWGNTS